MGAKKNFSSGVLFYVTWILASVVLILGVSLEVKAQELYMYSGAGLRQPVDELVGMYKQKHGVTINTEYGGSGQMLARYQATGQGDIFLSGSKFYVDQLEKDGQTLKIGSVVLHTPVLAVNKDKKDEIKTFEDLTRPGIRIGLGDPKAMALGRTAEDILTNSGLKESILKNVVVRAATVKQLTLYTVKGEIDASIIARADVFQNKDTLVTVDIERSWYEPEIVTVAILKASQQVEEATKFLEFLQMDEAVQVFGRYGFLPCK